MTITELKGTAVIDMDKWLEERHRKREEVRVEEVREVLDSAEDTKPTNPKDVVALTKVPMGLMPDSAIIAGNMAFHEGAVKYGKYNWRVMGVSATVYIDALKRHIAAYWGGEDTDPDSGLPHLWKALACLAIMIDAEAVGKLTDDRPPRADMGPAMKALEPFVAEINKRYADRHPHQWTIKDPLPEGK